MHFEMTPRGPFDLAHNNATFSQGGWPPFAGDPAAIGMAFPVEGWRTSAAVLVRQTDHGQIQGEVVGADADADTAWKQALAVISLDVDGAGWPKVAERDPILGRLQQQYHYLRPILFYSPYEAAAALIIGQRISIQQGRALHNSRKAAVH